MQSNLAVLRGQRDRSVERAAARLVRDGFLIIPRAADADLLDALYRDLDPSFNAAPFCQGLFYGERTKRFGRLLARSPHAAAFALHETVLPIVKAVLEPWGGVQLNLSQAIEIFPGAQVQPPHRDHDMWPCEKSPMPYMINVMWALDDFTPENGATRLWPRSNHGDLNEMLPDEEAIEVSAPRGSAILFLGSTLHSGGENRSSRSRRGMIFSYCQEWLLPDENPWLAYPPEIARGFAPELAALVGYRQRFAGLNNFEGCCPSVLLKEGLPEYLAFTDDMSPEQNELIRIYYAQREQRVAA